MCVCVCVYRRVVCLLPPAHVCCETCTPKETVCVFERVALLDRMHSCRKQACVNVCLGPRNLQMHLVHLSDVCVCVCACHCFRAAHLGSNFLRSMSRTPQSAGLREKQDDEYGRLHASGLHSTGRMLLNLWRIIRGEVRC